ncbi:MAG: dihydroorotate dehydrogenase (quinone), partial [Planctomycetota bacterium]
APLNARALAMTRLLASRTHGKLPIIGVGGILTPQDAIERLRAGAHLIQLYTGLIYEGPFLVRRVLKELVRTCEREGLSSVSELRGRAR